MPSQGLNGIKKNNLICLDNMLYYYVMYVICKYRTPLTGSATVSGVVQPLPLVVPVLTKFMHWVPWGPCMGSLGGMRIGAQEGFVVASIESCPLSSQHVIWSLSVNRIVKKILKNYWQKQCRYFAPNYQIV